MIILLPRRHGGNRSAQSLIIGMAIGALLLVLFFGALRLIG
jgi:hypothetical protein